MNRLTILVSGMVKQSQCLVDFGASQSKFINFENKSLSNLNYFQIFFCCVKFGQILEPHVRVRQFDESGCLRTRYVFSAREKNTKKKNITSSTSHFFCSIHTSTAQYFASILFYFIIIFQLQSCFSLFDIRNRERAPVIHA